MSNTQPGRHSKNPPYQGDFGYYVDAQNNVVYHSGESYIDLPWHRRFIDKKAAQNFAEANEVPLSPFVVDENLHPEPTTNRRQRVGEPPIVEAGQRDLVNKESFTHVPGVREGLDLDALAQQGFVPPDESPNMRNLDNPHARYIGAQVRSAYVSGTYPAASIAGDFGFSRDIASIAIVDGMRAVIRNTHRGYLHDFNLPAYEDDHCIMYFENGVVHRDPADGPAVIFKTEPLKIYVYHGLFHNPYGPAVIAENMVAYYLNGLLHNVGYPAVVYFTGMREHWEKGRHLYTVPAPAPDEPSAGLATVAESFAQAEERDGYIDREADGMSLH